MGVPSSGLGPEAGRLAFLTGPPKKTLEQIKQAKTDSFHILPITVYTVQLTCRNEQD